YNCTTPHRPLPSFPTRRSSDLTLKSDLRKVDAHVIRPHEYKELPELSASALSRAVVNKGGRPRSANPRKLISIRLPVDVIEQWRSEEHTSELQSRSELVCRLLL